MTNIVKKLVEAFEDHRTHCIGIAVRAGSADRNGEQIRAELDAADAKLLDTIISALEGIEGMAPDGWVLVPEEATGAMWEAGMAADEHPGDSYSAVYRAMIEAAPALTSSPIREGV